MVSIQEYIVETNNRCIKNAFNNYGLNEDGEKRSTYLDDVTHFMILPTQKPKQAKSYEPWKA